MMKANNIELRAALDELLHRHDANLGRIVRLDSSPCPDRTSFNLIDIEVELEDGTLCQLLLKDLGRKDLHETARRVKPSFLYNPMREIKTYQEILAPIRLGTAHCYGAVVRPDDDQYWLFLEKVAGLRLSQVRDYSAWLESARWLAHLHCRFAEQADYLTRLAPLVRYDAAFYRLWLERALKFQSFKLPKVVWEALIGKYERAVERIILLPATLIHGEFYASNILVQETSERFRICPVDWETAAVGPGLIDLAALSSGTWSERERTEMAGVYSDTLASVGTPALPLYDLLSALDDCRLHLAIRWLGWAVDWSPPNESAHDWLAEAIALSEKML
jgi:Phosphotransferase enzyme family